MLRHYSKEHFSTSCQLGAIQDFSIYGFKIGSSLIILR